MPPSRELSFRYRYHGTALFTDRHAHSTPKQGYSIALARQQGLEQAPFRPGDEKDGDMLQFSATPKVAVFYQLDDLGKCEQRRRSTPRPFEKLQQIGVCCIEPRRYRNPGGLLEGARTAFATSSPADVVTKTVCWTLFALCLPHQDPWMSRPRIDARVRPREDVILHAIAPKPFFAIQAT